MRHAHSTALIIGLAIATLAIPASANVTQADLLIAGRAMGFINNLKRGDVHVGIVYDPGMAESTQEATQINAMMAGGLRIGNSVFKPVMVPIGKLASAGVDVFLVSEGLDAAAANVGRASRARKIPCVTFDLAQVRNGNCAMGVRSQPTIEVLVNQAAADASGLELAAVFRMMITGV